MNTCQSCGMPMDDKTVSKHDKRNCIYCQNQNDGSLKSFDEVRTGCIGAAVRLMNKTKEEAEKMADEMLPKLSRWKK